MTPAHRPGSRFFAAFYRWSVHNHGPHQCSLRTLNGQRNIAASRLQHYHATRSLLQQNDTQVRPDDIYDTFLGEEKEKSASQKSRLPNSSEPSAELPGDFTMRRRLSFKGNHPHNQTTVFESDDGPELKDQVRTFMRQVPSSVTVITVAHRHEKHGRNEPMGVAVSSLCTVTLDPPTISFNIKQPSQTLSAIRNAGGKFRVHFLAPNRASANIVVHFSKGNDDEAYRSRRRELRMYIPSVKSDETGATAKPPQLTSESVRAAMDCTLTQELTVADHVILVAKVDKMVSRNTNGTLLYFDRSFRNPDGARITHANTEKLAEIATGPLGQVWEFPLFPGQKEREHYVKLLKDYIKAKPDYMRPEWRDAQRTVRGDLPMNPGRLGIHLGAVIDECRQESGLFPESPRLPDGEQVLTDFYGRLTPSAMNRIATRAKKLVKADLRFFDRQYRALLLDLGMVTSMKNFLPSDIMKPLRADNLVDSSVDSFQPRTGGAPTNSGGLSVVQLEKIEQRLVEYLRSLGFERAASENLEHAMQQLGEFTNIATYFKPSIARLHALAFPDEFDPANFDISGEVTAAETRVIFSRIIFYTNPHDMRNFRLRFQLNPNDTLRKLGIHPCISGIDIDFFFEKMAHVYRTRANFIEVAPKINEMVAPWFVSETAWEDLGQRVKTFVQESPLRAMRWSTRDKLAAMGLSWDAVIVVPMEDKRQMLNNGHIINTIIAKELKDLYGNTTEDVDVAIAAFLKKEYNFDVVRRVKSSQKKPAEETSSADEVTEGMEKSRTVGIS